MARALIRLGDSTSHGGTVIEASGMSGSGNMGISRVGDKVTCPIPGHGTNPIVSGDPTFIVDGQPVAREGDQTACGATLMPSQFVTTASNESAQAVAARPAGRAFNASAAGASAVIPAVLAAATTPPSLPQWSGDSAQWSQDKKLQSMNPTLRPKVQAVLAALTQRGFQPKIVYGWRSVAVQLQLFQQGNSKVKFSFHNAQKPDGTPNAYAADIIDSRYAWTPQAETSGFWKALGEEAKKQDLYWGGDWSKPDWAHVQLAANSELARVKTESGL